MLAGSVALFSLLLQIPHKLCLIRAHISMKLINAAVTIVYVHVMQADITLSTNDMPTIIQYPHYGCMRKFWL